MAGGEDPYQDMFSKCIVYKVGFKEEVDTGGVVTNRESRCTDLQFRLSKGTLVRIHPPLTHRKGKRRSYPILQSIQQSSRTPAKETKIR